MNESLIFDWNQIGAAPKPPVVMLDDETLRDGLQSPSVRTPTIGEKIRILHLIDALGIDTADIGLPGAGAHVADDVEQLAREIVSARLRVANCAARTHVNDIRPIVEITQRTGLPIEVAAFIGSSPIRQFTEGWTLDWLLRNTEEAIGFAVKEGLDVMRHRGHHPRRPRDAARHLHLRIRAGARRICVADTVGTRRRPAPRRWSASPPRSSASPAPRSASTGTATATATSPSSTASPPSTPGPAACTAPRSASASGSATRRSISCWSISS